jgi:purine-binding chemotaxis protein CheW
MDNTYLVFGYRGARYGLDARAVREIVWLPELSPIEELPRHIVGVFNLRGRIVPAMDLGVRFGHPREAYRLADRVIVLESEGVRVGVVVNELYEVASIPQAAVEGVQGYQALGACAHFVCGQAKLGGGLAMLLDANALLKSAPPEEALAADPAEPGATNLAPAYAPAPASDEETKVFRERAGTLAREPDLAERMGLSAYAVIRLGGELFGLDIAVVREFAHIGSVAPVPCCPPWILGNMNLRGDILTLLDIRPALGLAAEEALSEVVVARMGELLMGLPAAQIVDVVYLDPADIAAVPVSSDGAGKQFCKGVANDGGRAIGILDLVRIMAARELQVAQEVH